MHMRVALTILLLLLVLSCILPTVALLWSPVSAYLDFFGETLEVGISRTRDGDAECRSGLTMSIYSGVHWTEFCMVHPAPPAEP